MKYSSGKASSGKNLRAAGVWIAHQRTGDRSRAGDDDLAGNGADRPLAAAGNFASYARCVDSVRTSNGKKKGEGNTKNGNKYLAWAFVEAANFALRYCAEAKRFYERKKAKTNNVVAIKALAHKLARACFHILKERKPFDMARCFA